MNVHFYLPEQYWPDAERQKAWKAGEVSALEQSGKIACAQCWIYQTWVALERAGVETTLSSKLPSSGLMIALTGYCSDDFRPTRDVFFAGIVADSLPHPGAHIQILQNPFHAHQLGNSVYVPLWPHPNLLPRDPGRGSKFENVCFFGDERNLASELQDPKWQKRLENLGLRLILRSAAHWHDYREADCVIALRGFGPSNYLHKPGTKMYNAWLAGVPFIGGRDSAYAGDGCPGKNYLQAFSPDALLDRIQELRDDCTLRESLTAEGHLAARRFSSSATLDRWKTLLTSELPAQAEAWRTRGPLSRRAYFFLQQGRVWRDRTFRH